MTIYIHVFIKVVVFERIKIILRCAISKRTHIQIESKADIGVHKGEICYVSIIYEPTQNAPRGTKKKETDSFFTLYLSIKT